MTAPGITEIRIDEDGTQTHESWIHLTTSKVQSTERRLFSSDVTHQHYVSVSVYRCQRRRALHQDRSHTTELLLTMDMSFSQWGSFVSSFGDGGGVPATLTFFNGDRVPEAPFESRLAQSHEDVRAAGEAALAEIQQAHADLQKAFEEGAGRRVMREKMRDLDIKMQNTPANRQFAAKMLTKHSEDVVTRARADVEAMRTSAQDRGIEIEGSVVGELGA